MTTAERRARVELACRAARAAARLILGDYPHLRTPELLRGHGVLEDIAQVHRARVVDGGLIGASGRLTRTRRRALIRVRDDNSGPGRRDFTIAHELGHLVLGHGICLSVVCSETEADQPRSSLDEISANAFAAELLMPETMVGPLCAVRGVDLAVARHLAMTFQTSLVASARRLVEVTEVPCAVAYSQNGLVTWARRSRTYRGYVPTKHRVTPDSVAASYYATGHLQSEPCRVPASAWGRSAHASDDLIEQSIVCDEPRGVLTLLWIADQAGDRFEIDRRSSH